jgi:serine protease AprX
MQINREVFEKLIFGHRGSRRFTQDSPVLPDVWIAYSQEPDAQQDLLLNPNKLFPPGKLSKALNGRLQAERQTPHWIDLHAQGPSDANIAYNQSTVVACLYFDELVRVVLPLTDWWAKYMWPDISVMLTDSYILMGIVQALDDPSWERKKDSLPNRMSPRPTPEMLWLIRLVGSLVFAKTAPANTDILNLPSGVIVKVFAGMIGALVPVEVDNRALIWSVTRNRPAATTVWRSTLSVKADAALQLFNISCKDIRWAVIDTGIDATHPAFRLRGTKGELLDEPFVEDAAGRVKNQTRVLGTYDFTQIRQILRTADDPSNQPPLPDAVSKRFDESDDSITALRAAIARGGFVDWDLLEPLLRVPQTPAEYAPPVHEHGTHVAGILGADWRKDENGIAEEQDIRGVCPDIRLYDLRALDENGQGDEFTIMSALQFVRYLNAHTDHTVVHGVNLSLSLRHDVANYACGRTPVCEECERVVNSGVVVVAAAGNDGYMRYITSDGGAPEYQMTEGYRSISITDPGNADSVITVGATHAFRPHTFGVSYFSSRGPTGDGRIKPDLVAPGEKITSTVPGEGAKRKDGTSMAAPHVSGAAALLLARYNELIGQPERVKEVLCSTATDLKRERYFQGSGMLDILRALQAV